MVVSKRCKICAVLDSNNASISGEYFGKLIPDLIDKICGIELDPRKANGVLICQSCIIQLVYTDVVIDKLRNSLQRLKKNVKETKPKTQFRKSVDMEKSIKESEVSPQNMAEESFLESNTTKTKPENEIKPNSLKKAVRRKSVFPDDKLEKNDKVKPGTPEIVTSPNVKNKLDNDLALKKKTPTKPTKRKIIPLIDEALNNNTSSDAKLKNSFVVEATPVKIKKKCSTSISEESPMDLTLDEQGNTVFNKKTNDQERRFKEMNCIICGKSFHSKSALRDHIETSHMGERLKACPHCSSEFRSQQKFESHVFSEKCKNANHACHFPNCYKRFKTVHKMELHMQEKHSSQNESETD